MAGVLYQRSSTEEQSSCIEIITVLVWLAWQLVQHLERRSAGGYVWVAIVVAGLFLGSHCRQPPCWWGV